MQGFGDRWEIGRGFCDIISLNNKEICDNKGWDIGRGFYDRWDIGRVFGDIISLKF